MLAGSSPGPTPLYYRLREALRERIQRGEFPPGARLPTEEELCRDYAVSRITVIRALRDLVAEGLIERRQGRGTFVATPVVEQDLLRLTDFVEDMTRAGLTAESCVVGRETVPAPAHVTQALGLPPDTAVLQLCRLRLATGAPIAFDITWLAPTFAPLVADADLEHETIYGILERRHQITVERGEYLIEAVAADAGVAAVLGVGAGAPLLLFHRTSWAADGRVIYHQERYYRGDRVRYRLLLERSEQAAGRPRSTIREFAPVFKPLQ
ncbi:MAG TPA: GntR family transcriptional regulator [Chloroflexota bacterium]|nr:GntR family transcriptional regulator [Chloroflexota bacterium]